MASSNDLRYQTKAGAIRRCLSGLVACVLVGVASVSFAQENENAEPVVQVPDKSEKEQPEKKLEKFTYKVQVDAPPKISQMLQENLKVCKWQHDAEMNDRQLRRMYRAAPAEVRELMETEGYYSPEVKTELLGEEGDRTVVIKVDPGKPVKVTDVRIAFTGDVVGTKKKKGFAGEEGLKKGWKMPVGTVFRMEDWETAKLSLFKELSKVRYPRASIKHTQAVVDPENHSAQLEVEMDSGKEVRFGETIIIGLRRYSERVVQGLHPPKEGSVYDEDVLHRFQSRLLDSGYFNGADVVADLETGRDDIPVIVKVHENYQKHASVGIGYSTDTRERLSLSYENFNFIRQDWHLKSSAVVQDRQQTAKADVFLPENEDGFRDSFGVAYDRSDFRGLDTRTIGLNVRRAWGSPAFEQYVMLEYLNEHDRIEGAHGERPEALPVTYGFIKRHLDNRIAPRKGYQFEAQVGGAVEGMVTDESFVRGYLKGRFYLPVGQRGDIIVRGEAGAVFADDKKGVPATVMFRAGGDQSVRGYSYDSLGIRRGDAVVGGRYLAVGSLEYQHYFWDTWGLAVFVDAGNVADKWSDIDYAVGYGVGVRWRSPAGPVGVDLAYGEKTGNFHLHFSFGLTF